MKEIMIFRSGCLLIWLTALMLFPACKYGTTNSGNSENDKGVVFKLLEENRQVEVYIEGELFTSYIFPENIAKPVLYPVISANGKTITRGFPINTRPGERVDHPHHVGLWFNYGDVNGLDFWNNSERIPEDRKHKYGHIEHQNIIRMENGKEKGILEVSALWKTNGNRALLNEITRFEFSWNGDTRLIDRITTLNTIDEEVLFRDNKEGMIAIRVARGLELPSDVPIVFTDLHGNPTKVKVLDNTGVNGNYLSSEGKEDNDVWGTRARWVKLEGTIDEEKTGLAIIDHPDNVGYPTYWHARGYGLFSANPLGWEIFTGGKESLNFKLAKGESVSFKYRILVHSGSDLKVEDLNKYADDFSGSF